MTDKIVTGIVKALYGDDDDMTYREFLDRFPDAVESLTYEDIRELITSGYVAVGVGDRRVFTLRIEVAESDIKEMARD